MCDGLLPKRMCSGSRDFLKFREVTDNISETVQVHSCSGTLIENHMWPIE